MTAPLAAIMMTPDQIRAANVDFDIAKEALAQSERRLTDALDAKKAVEQKATVLFGAYVTISLALFGFGGAFARDAALSGKAWPFFVAGSLFVIGAGAFLFVFRSAEYGNLGSEPAMWLQPGRIDGDRQEFARMLAYLVHYHSQRIDKSYKSNERKSRALHIGMIAGIVGAVALLVATIFTYVPWATHP